MYTLAWAAWLSFHYHVSILLDPCSTSVSPAGIIMTIPLQTGRLSCLLYMAYLIYLLSLQRSIAEVVVYCAPHDCSQAGQMEIFEEVNRTYQKPKKVISLTDVNQPGVQSGSPCSSLSSSPGNAAFSSSPSNSTGLLYPFQVLLKSGEIFEFFAELPEDQRQWVKRLSLLFMFPSSPIPEEPINPIKDSFRAKLNPADYRAGVY